MRFTAPLALASTASKLVPVYYQEFIDIVLTQDSKSGISLSVAPTISSHASVLSTVAFLAHANPQRTAGHLQIPRIALEINRYVILLP